MSDKTLIVKPIAGDKDIAEEMVERLEELMHKHKALLTVRRAEGTNFPVIAICVQNRPELTWRAIAEVKLISGIPVLVDGQSITTDWRTVTNFLEELVWEQ